MTQVLIVDDEAPVRRLLQRWVEQEGAEVLAAESAEEALEVAAYRAPAVAIFDVNLPGRDGMWLARRFRADHTSTAVVMATGLMESGVALQGLNAGAVDYLVKPFTRERMAQALRWALFTHRSRHALAQQTGADAEAEQRLDDNIAAVLALMRLHRPDVHDHARRVASLSRDLALALNVRQPQLGDIERAALLHDLAGDRFAADVAADDVIDWSSVLRVPTLHASLTLAAAAQQPYDPTSGDTLLGARIIAVAEAYDELVSGLHGGAVESSDAIEILCTMRALEFDPAVLDALGLVRNGAAA